MICMLHSDVRYLPLMENPAHHSGHPGCNRSVTGMWRSLWVHEPRPETTASHPLEYDTGLHLGVMLDHKHKTTHQHARIDKESNITVILLITSLPEKIISSILLLFCTAASCSGIHPRSSTLDRFSGCTAILFSASSSPKYEHTHYIRSPGKIDDNRHQLQQVKELHQLTLLDRFEDLIRVFTGFQITIKRNCT